MMSECPLRRWTLTEVNFEKGDWVFSVYIKPNEKRRRWSWALHSSGLAFFISTIDLLPTQNISFYISQYILCKDNLSRSNISTTTCSSVSAQPTETPRPDHWLLLVVVSMVRGVGGVGDVKIVLSMVWDIGRAVPRWILSTFNFIIVVSKKTYP